MKVSEVIATLTRLQAEHGDMDVLIDAGGLLQIDEIDVPMEDEGIVIWPVYESNKD